MSIWHVVCHIYTINFSNIHVIIQYFFVLNKVSVINLLLKNDGDPQTSKKNVCSPRKKRVPIPELKTVVVCELNCNINCVNIVKL